MTGTHKWAAIALAAALAGASAPAAADCHRGTATNEVVGTLLGAAIGGLVGSQIGSGSGNKVAIGAGVLAGGLFGNKIGQRLDCEDQRRHQAAAADAFEYQRSGTGTAWRNPDSGSRGEVVPTRTFQRGDGSYCREFTQTITVDGRFEEATGVACRDDDGRWRVVSS